MILFLEMTVNLDPGNMRSGMFGYIIYRWLKVSHFEQSNKTTVREEGSSGDFEESSDNREKAALSKPLKQLQDLASTFSGMQHWDILLPLTIWLCCLLQQAWASLQAGEHIHHLGFRVEHRWDILQAFLLTYFRGCMANMHAGRIVQAMA